MSNKEENVENDIKEEKNISPLVDEKVVEEIIDEEIIDEEIIDEEIKKEKIKKINDEEFNKRVKEIINAGQDYDSEESSDAT